ncbi:MAG: TIGR02453 family protein [gamma proteobacterium symbiont of Stewartia floridana]|nr:MAG: TIGR02453 family protein [gamma proteobacterium symbiont of Stewartia floridana]
MREFSGFPKQTLPFLKKLGRNNQREWFNEHKQEYETYVREPAFAFIEEMAPKLKALSDHFHAIAKKSGGSLMRVYRDTRFSKDKTPYKTNIGIQFRHQLGKDVHAPGFYLHIENGGCFIGAGIWHPESKTLGKIRNFIADNPASWSALKEQSDFSNQFELAGDSLKRAPKGFAPDHPLIEDLKRKDFIALKSFDCSQINRVDFADFVMDGFQSTDQLMRYLCTAVEVNY